MDKIHGEQTSDVGSVNVAKWYRIYSNENGLEENKWIVDEGTSDMGRFCFKVIILTDKPVSAEHDGFDSYWILAYGILRELKDRRGRVVITITKT